ncbi:MAG: hypothetical protein KL863_08970 [Rhizobium sp.]|nr:hypothetical protein [Rhizobium sp.]
MAKKPVTLQTTEIIVGVKCRAGDVVELDENDPIAIKTAAMEKAGGVPAPKVKSDAG